LGIEDHVTLVDRYIANEEVGVYFSAADAVVLPYITATQTGIVQIAYAFGKPAIVTNVGGLPEVVEDGKTGFVVEARSPRALADAADSLYEPSRQAEFARNIACKREHFSWDRMVEVIDNLVTLHP
jgi:glycosyltransferase involved in cell wall biosynthesis